MPSSDSMLAPDLLREILENQGYRELAAAHLFASGVRHAPTIDDKQMLADHAREELHHFEKVSTFYEEACGGVLEQKVAPRVAGFPTPGSWLEHAVAGFVFDRAVFCQLKAYEKLGDARLALLSKEIVEHELEHQAAAETALLDLSRDEAFVRETAQEHISHWVEVAMRSLDSRPSSSGEPGAARKSFFDSIAPTVKACGLVAKPGLGAREGR